MLTTDGFSKELSNIRKLSEVLLHPSVDNFFEIEIDENITTPLYLYLDTPEAVKNIRFNEEIWFSGINQYRFPNGIWNENSADLDEGFYQETQNGCTRTSTAVLHPLSLALSTISPEAAKDICPYLANKPYVIVIEDLQKFMQTINLSLENLELAHKLSLLNPETLIRSAREVDRLSVYRKKGAGKKEKAIERILTLLKYETDYSNGRPYPFESYREMTSTFSGISALKMSYFDPKEETKLFFSDESNKAIVSKTYGLDKKLMNESEIRIMLKYSELLGLNKQYIGMIHPLIQFLKISCPDIRNCCRPIGAAELLEQNKFS